MNDLDLEWERFLNNDFHIQLLQNKVDVNIPKCSPLYISTKTKIAYFNHDIILDEVFWKIPIINYNEHQNGVIKKQMKFNLTTKEQTKSVNHKLDNYNYFKRSHSINYVDTLTGKKHIYKDIRKVTMGICNKDILSRKIKEKSAFYNCFVLILRIKYQDYWREAHVKVFNTGKVEIPGIQDDSLFKIVLLMLKDTIQPYIDHKLNYEDKIETVLINSNFNTGYMIKREEFYNILKNKYKIHAVYDPCSYPGIQCKYKVNNASISFMVFRTGSILVVGKCEDEDIYELYDYLKGILNEEYENICQTSTTEESKKIIRSAINKTKRSVVVIPRVNYNDCIVKLQ